MAIERIVEFVTLGEAAEMLKTPAPTLRGWADKLEEMGIHRLERNHRQERIFYESDLEIFRFIRDQKDVHGRKSTTEDLARLIKSMAEEDGAFHLRPIEGMSVPILTPTPQLTQIDMERLLQQEAFREWIENIHRELNKETTNKLNELQNEIIALRESQERRDQEITRFMRKSLELRRYESLPFYKKWFTKPPGDDD